MQVYEMEFNTMNGMNDLGNTFYTDDFYNVLRRLRAIKSGDNKVVVSIDESGLFCLSANGNDYVKARYCQGMVFDLNNKYAGGTIENYVIFTLDYLEQRQAGLNFRNV
jgi:hypothetical protein